jgi:outer membrane protein assembly factor BamA
VARAGQPTHFVGVKGRLRPWLVAALLVGITSPAFAADDQGDDKRDNQADSKADDQNGTPPLELAIVPLVGGDTDVGIGGGALGSVARPAPGDKIFRWKLEGAAFGTTKRQEGKFTSPYQDIYLMLTLKDLARGRLRLELRVAYTRESNLRYYGIGNAAPAPIEERAARDFFTRTHPAAWVRARFKLTGPLQLLLGTMYMHNTIEFDPESTLLRDAAMGSETVRSLLTVNTDHGLHLLEAGLIYDSRDNEVAPTRGQHHRFNVRASPFESPALPYRYVGLSGSLSGFAPIRGDKIVLAGRLVGDIMMGTVPFYELSRFDETSAIGGPKYVRGVPSNRYWGKRKLMANLEVRAALFEFGVGKSRYELGSAAFFDAGRVWAELGQHEELDGTGWGIKYGTGAGLRLRKGTTFVLRADVAWSPDARPIGGYFLADHIF